jgi:hypothetical protein
MGVTPGLDPGVYRLRKTLFAGKMDCRVEPANDDDLMRTLFHAAGEELLAGR